MDSIGYLHERYGELRHLSMADQGAGRLRHLTIFATHFGCTFVVDTRRQLYRRQELYGRPGRRVVDVAKIGREDWCRTRAVTADAFDRTTLGLDVIFSVCVYDAVPRVERKRLARAAFRNLAPGGLYIVVAPRNNSSILARCGRNNRYDDGYVFTQVRHVDHLLHKLSVIATTRQAVGTVGIRTAGGLVDLSVRVAALAAPNVGGGRRSCGIGCQGPH